MNVRPSDFRIHYLHTPYVEDNRFPVMVANTNW